jgi:hypothetical protein
MKTGKATADEVLNFQTKLLDCLILAEKNFMKMAKERRRLIGKKGELNPAWFSRRMRTLAGYESSLLELLSTGKSLGDAFAWFFYREDRELLNRHLSKAKESHLPPGIGGLGEFELIKRVRGIAGHLLIYHGITNILRYGDISLVSLTNLRVSAIGEIKTTKISESEIEVRLFFYGNKVGVKKSGPQIPQKITFPDRLKQKLNRQLKEIADLYKKSSLRWPNNPELEIKNYYAELIELANACKPHKPAYKKAGEGLLLIGVKAPSINHTELPTKTLNLKKAFDDLPEAAKNIQSSILTDNINTIRTIDPRQGILPGTIPLFWWPVDNEILRQIYFDELFVFTIYNLAFLIQKLRALGLAVKWDEKNEELLIMRKTPERSEAISNNRYFIALVQSWLIREESVIELVKVFLEELKDNTFRPGTKVILQLIQDIRNVKK